MKDSVYIKAPTQKQTMILWEHYATCIKAWKKPRTRTHIDRELMHFVHGGGHKYINWRSPTYVTSKVVDAVFQNLVKGQSMQLSTWLLSGYENGRKGFLANYGYAFDADLRNLSRGCPPEKFPVPVSIQRKQPTYPQFKEVLKELSAPVKRKKQIRKFTIKSGGV
jgi:hypothetical protein|tara:strand:- start:59 stop:553 length:495 start_codon:yes stop_codon:yes gene_type:complete